MDKKFFYTIIGLVVLFLVVWQRFFALQLTIIISNHEKELNQYENKYKNLSFELEKLNSIDRLETFAKETLNMIYPDGDNYASGNDD